jgi:uncharacterized protein with FMN-binding domain
MKNRPLVALSSAVIVAVYTAGYMRTRAAAERFDTPAEPRRPAQPVSPAAPDAPRGEGRLTVPPPAGAPSVVARRTPADTRVPPSSVAAAAASAPPPLPGDVAPPPGFDAQSVQDVAQPSIDAPPPAGDAADKAAALAERGPYKDGTYTGWGYCRHGDIQASVFIEGGRIASARVAQCQTRYSCNWIEPLYRQVALRQSAEVDYISGASESSDAFHDAVAEALAKAK